MPKARRQFDVNLREEAKNLLGRTPAQGWHKPIGVEIASERRISVVDLIEQSRDKYYVDRGELQFTIESTWIEDPPQTSAVRPSPDLLDRFLGLETAPAEKIREFASKFGALLVFCKVMDRGLEHMVIVESCAVWRYFAAAMLRLLRIASCYHSDRRVDPADWERIGACPASMVRPPKPRNPLSLSSWDAEDAWSIMVHFVRRGTDRDRKMWTRLLNILLELGRVRPWLIWEGKGSIVQPKLAFSGSNLLSYLALQLVLRASRHDALAVCSYCSKHYLPQQRAPKTGQRNFCPECRARSVPLKIAQRARRERLRAAGR